MRLVSSLIQLHFSSAFLFSFFHAIGISVGNKQPSLCSYLNQQRITSTMWLVDCCHHWSVCKAWNSPANCIKDFILYAWCQRSPPNSQPCVYKQWKFSTMAGGSIQDSPIDKFHGDLSKLQKNVSPSSNSIQRAVESLALLGRNRWISLVWMTFKCVRPKKRCQEASWFI
jgi:hypothetical protein